MTEIAYQLEVDGIHVEVVRRKVKYLRLQIRSPDGGVRVIAPRQAPRAFVEQAIKAKIPWIRHHQEKLAARSQEPPVTPTEGTIHFVSGRPHRLRIEFRPGMPSVALDDSGTLLLGIHPDATEAEREVALNGWYRERLQARIPLLIARWEQAMGVQVAAWGIKRMKTRWGSCNIRARRIWLNLELAKRSPECLEYVLVHELAHLLEPSHNARFKGILDRHLPGWRSLRVELNREPLS